MGGEGQTEAVTGCVLGTAASDAIGSPDAAWYSVREAGSLQNEYTQTDRGR